MLLADAVCALSLAQSRSIRDVRNASFGEPARLKIRPDSSSEYLFVARDSGVYRRCSEYSVLLYCTLLAMRTL